MLEYQIPFQAYSCTSTSFLFNKIIFHLLYLTFPNLQLSILFAMSDKGISHLVSLPRLGTWHFELHLAKMKVERKGTDKLPGLLQDLGRCWAVSSVGLLHPFSLTVVQSQEIRTGKRCNGSWRYNYYHEGVWVRNSFHFRFFTSLTVNQSRAFFPKDSVSTLKSSPHIDGVEFGDNKVSTQ